MPKKSDVNGITKGVGISFLLELFITFFLMIVLSSQQETLLYSTVTSMFAMAIGGLIATLIIRISLLGW